MNISRRVIEHRRWLHQHPELGFEEHETSDYIAQHLEKAGIPFKRAKTGIIADINVGASETTALRADIDALPIQEVEGRTYGSRNPGRMHACGHDAHAAMLLTAAEYMAEIKPKKNVRLIFQPAEERIGGARFMIKHGALDNVNMIFGIHVWAKTKSGVFGVKSGPLMAGVSEIKLIVSGNGGHAAFPHETINPIAVGATTVNELYKIHPLNMDPLESAVVNVTAFNSGNAFNVVPEKAEILGTIRTFSNSTKEKIFSKIRDLKKLAKSLGADLDVKLETLTAPVVNSKEAIDIAIDVLQKLNFKFVEAMPGMGGEDFAFYLEKVPGAFLFLGIRNEERGTISPHHSPTFDVDEDVLENGVKFFLGVSGVE